MIHAYKCAISSDCEEKTHSFHAFFWHTRPSYTFSFTKAPRCLKLLIPASNATGRWGITVELSPKCSLNRNNWFVLHKLQHKTPSAPESPLSLCYVTDRERRGEWGCACAQNLNTCCVVPWRKLTSACVLIAVMGDWNSSNNFDTSCTLNIPARARPTIANEWKVNIVYFYVSHPAVLYYLMVYFITV